MTDCIYCEKPLYLAKNDGQEHDVCYAEFDRREQKGLCEYCGKNKAVETSTRCVDCYKNCQPHIGYPDL